MEKRNVVESSAGIQWKPSFAFKSGLRWVSWDSRFANSLLTIIGQETRLARTPLDQNEERPLFLQMRSPWRKKTPKEFRDWKTRQTKWLLQPKFIYFCYSFRSSLSLCRISFQPTDRSAEREDIFQFLVCPFFVISPTRAVDCHRSCESFFRYVCDDLKAKLGLRNLF